MTMREKNCKSKKTIRTEADMTADKNYHKMFKDGKIIDKCQVTEAQNVNL